jgi:hypothetical protein
VAVAVVLAGAVGGDSWRGRAPSWPARSSGVAGGGAAGRDAGADPRSIDTTLLMWPAGSGQCCGPVAVDNLGTGRLAQSQQPAIGAGDFQPLLAQVGPWLVYVGDGVATAWSADDAWLLYQGPGGACGPIR